MVDLRSNLGSQFHVCLALAAKSRFVAIDGFPASSSQITSAWCPNASQVRADLNLRAIGPAAGCVERLGTRNLSRVDHLSP